MLGKVVKEKVRKSGFNHQVFSTKTIVKGVAEIDDESIHELFFLTKFVFSTLESIQFSSTNLILLFYDPSCMEMGEGKRERERE
jgi:hypothetical protein